MAGVFTIDLEDWYHPLGRAVNEWPSFECRAHVGTERLLDLLDAHTARATFFILGSAAERQPWLVRMIAERGHEVGTHGHHHERLGHMNPHSLGDDLKRSIDVLRESGASTVTSYRAPFFSLGPLTRWAIPVLANVGITIDSSLFPMRTTRYGVQRTAIADLVRTLADYGISELPISLPRYGPVTLPLTGGFYSRFFPRRVTRAALRRVASTGATPVFYIHPWELDPEQPRIPLPRILAFRHYLRLNATETTVDRVLSMFPWTSARAMIARAASEGIDVRPQSL